LFLYQVILASFIEEEMLPSPTLNWLAHRQLLCWIRCSL